MSLDAYQATLRTSSTLELRATRMLAEGCDGFEAAVLFHEAARAERRSHRALDAPTPETRLAAAIEEHPHWPPLAGVQRTPR